jgi:hypothetical protein
MNKKNQHKEDKQAETGDEDEIGQRWKRLP